MGLICNVTERKSLGQASMADVSSSRDREETLHWLISVIIRALNFLSFLVWFYILLLLVSFSLIIEAPRSKVPEGSCTKDSLRGEFKVWGGTYSTCCKTPETHSHMHLYIRSLNQCFLMFFGFKSIEHLNGRP